MKDLHRPEPLLRHAAQPVDQDIQPGRVAKRLCEGEMLIVTDNFSTGVRILSELRNLMSPPPQDAGYEVRRSYERNYRETSHRLLAPIANHRVALSDSPTIGFLQQLYPDYASFDLPFEEVQELNSAWTWYQRGVHLPVLGYRLHPFYGTYVPSRVLHLELFSTWLSQYKGPRTRAVDVGTGCGVLALLLCKAGFQRVLATDCNPNAIESVARQLKQMSSNLPIDLHYGDLLGDDRTPADLIVFNPPWMQGKVEGSLDRALYYEEGLFERFFDQASERLTPQGRIVLVFSSLIRLVQPDLLHPIDIELERGRFKLAQKLSRKVKAADTKSRRRTRERVEVWELASM